MKRLVVMTLAALGLLASTDARAIELGTPATEHPYRTQQNFALELPGFWLTLGQVGLGVADLAAAAAALYFLLPRGHGVEYPLFLGLYAFACLLGIASNAPGGIGVFEVTMLKVVDVPAPEAMLASLLLFRVVYYLLPFVLALALLGANESIRRWNVLREAMDTREGDED